jgi:hypothetical protein
MYRPEVCAFRWLLPALALGLSACAALRPEAGPAPGAVTEAPAEPASLPEPVIQIATQPLSDFNLLSSEIPPVLVAAQKAPYAEPAGHSCPAVIQELQALDVALGPDVDAAPRPAADPGLVEQAAGAVGDFAVGTVKNTVNTVVDGVVPFRSWVRRLSGAESHSSAVAAAISAGTLRRAFLKGWAQGTGCAKPAEPKTIPPSAEGKPRG